MKSEKEIESMSKKLIDWGKKVCPSNFDKFDWTAEIDGGISFSENKRIIKEKLCEGGLMEDEAAKYAHEKAEQERMIYETNLEAIEEVKAYNEQVKQMKRVPELDSFYKPIYKAVRKMKAGYSNMLLVRGAGGIGKTWNIRVALEEEPHAEYKEIRGDITPAYLYRVLYENMSRVLYFNDVNRLLRHPEGINMLKAATEMEERRLICKLSYSRQQEDLPSEFIFKGKIIFDYNYIEPAVQPDFDAFMSRAEYIELNFCQEDIEHVMRILAKEDWQKQVTEWVIEQYHYNGQNPLNLRTQQRAFNTFKYAEDKGLDWKHEVESELKASMSKFRGLLYSLIGSKAVRRLELKKKLIMAGVVGTIRTADRRIEDWLQIGELYKVSQDGRDYHVCINPIGTKQEKVVLNESI